MGIKKATETAIKDLAASFNLLFEKLPADKKPNYTKIKLIINVLAKSSGLLQNGAGGKIIDFGASIISLNTTAFIKLLPESDLPLRLQTISSGFIQGTAHSVEKEIAGLFLNFLNNNRNNGVLEDLLSLGFRFWKNIEQILDGMVFPLLTENLEENQIGIIKNVFDIITPLAGISDASELQSGIQGLRDNTLLRQLIIDKDRDPRAQQVITALVDSVINNILLNDKFPAEQKTNILKSFKNIILYVEYKQLKDQLVQLKEKNSNTRIIEKKIAGIFATIHKDKIKRLLELDKAIASSPTKSSEAKELQAQLLQATAETQVLDIKSLLFSHNGRINSDILNALSIMISAVHPSAQAFINFSQIFPIQEAIKTLAENPVEFATLDLNGIDISKDTSGLLQQSIDKLKQAQITIAEDLQAQRNENTRAEQAALKIQEQLQLDKKVKITEVKTKLETKKTEHQKSVQDINKQIDTNLLNLTSQRKDIRQIKDHLKADDLLYVVTERLSTSNNNNPEKFPIAKRNADLLKSEYQNIIQQVNAIKNNNGDDSLVTLETLCDGGLSSIENLIKFIQNGGEQGFSEAQQKHIQENLAAVAKTPSKYPGKTTQEKLVELSRLFFETKGYVDFGNKSKGGARLSSIRDEKDFKLIETLDNLKKNLAALQSIITSSKEEVAKLEEQNTRLKEKLSEIKDDIQYKTEIEALEQELHLQSTRLIAVPVITAKELAKQDAKITLLKDETLELLKKYDDHQATAQSSAAGAASASPKDKVDSSISKQNASRTSEMLKVAFKITTKLILLPFVVLEKMLNKLYQVVKQYVTGQKDYTSEIEANIITRAVRLVNREEHDRRSGSSASLSSSTPPDSDEDTSGAQSSPTVTPLFESKRQSVSNAAGSTAAQSPKRPK